MKYYFSFVIAILLCGCGNVYTTKPIGENPKNLTHEVADWEGVWYDGSGNAFKIKVDDPSRGVLKVAAIEDDNNVVRLKEYTVFLRESGGWCFASSKDEDAKEGNLYNWARIATNDRQIICWVPDTDKFKALVSNGQLPGKVDDDKVILGDLNPGQMGLITSGSNGVLVQWENPLVLTKLSK